MFKWTERLAQDALANGLNWADGNILVPNFGLAGGEMDICMLTGSGYITEIEIKLSLDDWNADRLKDKWGRLSHDRYMVSRFFYAVPKELADKAPSWVPQEHGIIVLLRHPNGRLSAAYTDRQAKRLSDWKVTAPVRARIMKAFYFRYWTQRFKTKGEVL